QRFAAHVSYYGPCIARFADIRATGAPVLMLLGGRDAIIDVDRCRQVAGDLEAGGSAAQVVVFPEAYHQWDGRAAPPREVGRTIAGCRLQVGADAVVRDLDTGLPMTGRLARQAILGLCAGSGGFVIGRDDAVRARSNAVLADFLAPILR
ncbi:MAG: dienelactone hydrolase family protein, partial [Rhodospirillaceae bacterium]|nr:dienelactone hydrolase family protein [Rhodospirillaceae bacterium]